MSVCKVIIDNDAGLDDAMALMTALKAHEEKEWEILGITTTHGNTTLDYVVNNNLTVLQTLQKKIPLYKGSAQSLYEPLQRTGPPFHGEDGFGGVGIPEVEDRSLVQEEHAVEALVRMVKLYPGEVTVIALGPLTNIALAIRRDPSWSALVKKLVIMGGNMEGRGNIVLGAEFNFYADPEAAFTVLHHSVCPVHLFTWELCFRQVFTKEWRRDILCSTKTAGGKLMNRIEDLTIPEGHGKFTNYMMCDQVAVAAAVRPGIVLRSHQVYATVELAGTHTRGSLVIDEFAITEHQPNVTIIDEIDTEKLKDIMLWTFDHEGIELPPAVNILKSG